MKSIRFIKSLTFFSEALFGLENVIRFSERKSGI